MCRRYRSDAIAGAMGAPVLSRAGGRTPPGGNVSGVTDQVDATIHFRRPKAYVDTGAGYRVVIDGERRGVIRNGKELTLPVDPGRHQLQLRYYWCSSPVLEIDTRADETVELDCRPIDSGNPLAIFFRMFFARKHYMDLVPAEDLRWQSDSVPKPPRCSH